MGDGRDTDRLCDARSTLTSYGFLKREVAGANTGIVTHDLLHDISVPVGAIWCDCSSDLSHVRWHRFVTLIRLEPCAVRAEDDPLVAGQIRRSVLRIVVHVGWSRVRFGGRLVIAILEAVFSLDNTMGNGFDVG